LQILAVLYFEFVSLQLQGPSVSFLPSHFPSLRPPTLPTVERQARTKGLKKDFFEQNREVNIPSTRSSIYQIASFVFASIMHGGQEADDDLSLPKGKNPQHAFCTSRKELIYLF
jgi:hypothetical protein